MKFNLILSITILLITISFNVAKVTSPIPLSITENSYQKGDKSSRIVVQYIIDLTCSSTMDSWDLLSQVVELYKDTIKFEYRIFPLPYHQQAFILAKAAQVVDFYMQKSDSKSVFTFMNTAIKNQPLIYNDATSDMTYNDVVQLVGKWAVNGTGLSSEQYYEGFDKSSNNGNTIEMNTRYMWKYTTIHGFWGTPQYSINGIMVDGLETIEDWQKTLNSLIKQK